MMIRPVNAIVQPLPVFEGAGVRLIRSIATRTLNYLDPFLLFDHFGSDDPEDYLAGFPMHPHRGIETVTYMLAGAVDHRDSLGNAGKIGTGDVQWMTAGGGIMHEEMPKPVDGKMWGFQLWVNLPARLKMTRPRYQEVAAVAIPVADLGNGVRARVIAGEAAGVRGPVTEIAADPTYLDISLPARTTFNHPVAVGHAAFAYLFEGQLSFDSTISVKSAVAPQMLVFGDGDAIQVMTQDSPARFLLVSGQPLHEPIARYGPFVMNTRDEIEQALRDLQNGTFVQVG